MLSGLICLGCLLALFGLLTLWQPAPPATTAVAVATAVAAESAPVAGAPGTPTGPLPPVPAAAGPAAAPSSTPERAGSAVLYDAGQVFDVTKRDLHPPLTTKQAYIDWMLTHSEEKGSFLAAKWDRGQAIQEQEQIRNLRVLEAFLLVPREEFSLDLRKAYASAALPIGYGQTISGPHMVARMTDNLNPLPGQRVLEIGTGSGYQSAVLSELCNDVFTIEIVDPLARRTNDLYQRLESRYPEYGNIRRKVDDGYYGWPEHAPFDRIIVTCGIDHIPPELLRELAPEGIMVIPIGPPSGQTLLRIVKHVAVDGTVSLEREDIYHGKRRPIFVPFTGVGGGVHREETPADSGATQ